MHESGAGLCVLLLLGAAQAVPNCFSNTEFLPLARSILGFDDLGRVLTNENLKAEKEYSKEYKWKHHHHSRLVRHTACETEKCVHSLQRDQRFSALVQSLSRKNMAPNLTACVRIENNFIFFYNSYGPSLASLLENGDFMKRRERFYLYSQLSKIFGKLDENFIMFNNFALENILLVDKSVKRVQISDFSHTYVVDKSCDGHDNQILKPEIAVAGHNQHVCTQMKQVVALIALIEHIHAYHDFHKRHNADIVSRIRHYCSKGVDNKSLQKFLCSYIFKENLNSKDLENIKESLQSLTPRKKKKHH